MEIYDFIHEDFEVIVHKNLKIFKLRFYAIIYYYLFNSKQALIHEILHTIIIHLYQAEE